MQCDTLRPECQPQVVRRKLLQSPQCGTVAAMALPRSTDVTPPLPASGAAGSTSVNEQPAPPRVTLPRNLSATLRRRPRNPAARSRGRDQAPPLSEAHGDDCESSTTSGPIAGEGRGGRCADGQGKSHQGVVPGRHEARGHRPDASDLPECGGSGSGWDGEAEEISVTAVRAT